ncbi:MAG: tetratricopeptide repeat protein, partial [Planctomycetales bacterium]|nr:tetratricopeptide repeat protein [Planctomycetales bacterium]
YINLRLGDYPLGLKQLFEALPIIEPLQEDRGLADVYDSITGIYHHIGNYPEALDIAYKQLRAAQRAGDMQRVANANNNLSAIYFETGDQEKSKETLQSNLLMAKDIGHTRIECLTYINLAYYFLSVGEEKTAVKNGLLGLQVSRDCGYEMFEIHALHILGRSYQKTSCYDQALAHLEEAADRSRALGTKVTEILVLQTQGEVFRDMRQVERAKECLN